MWKPEHRLRGIGVLLAGLLAASGAHAAPPRSQTGKTLQRELDLMGRVKELRKGLSGLERERESLEYASALLDHRGRESLRRLDAYRNARDARERQTHRRARALYKLARGGVPRLVFEDVAARADGTPDHSAADRVVRGRTVRWLVLHDLRELSVHQRAEAQARAELLAATRELAAVSAVETVQRLQHQVLTDADQALQPTLLAAKKRTKRVTKRLGVETSKERYLLKQVKKQRANLKYAQGMQFLEKRSLRRPVRGRVVGRFGEYNHPTLRVPMHRNGVELRAKRGEKARALAPGVVAFVGPLAGYDQVVVLEHDGGFLSLTGRLLGVELREGDEVDAGQALGTVAPKARDDGLGHTVYLELRHGERPIDPAAYLSKR